jgi:hypothetical protein
MRVRARGVARAVVATLVGAGLVVGATRLPGSWAVRAARDVRTGSPAGTPVLSTAAVVCPGSELVGASGVEDIPIGGTVSAAAAPGGLLGGLEVSASPGVLTIASLTTTKATALATGKRRGAAFSAGYRGTRAIAVTGTDSMAAGLVATQQWAATRDTVRGLASTTCGEPTSDAWLVAGGGDAGRQERLVLANPGANPVSVDIELHGTSGVVDSPNGRDVVVPPRSRTTFLVDAVSGSEAAPAVHISTRGGLVTPILNDTWLDGSRAAGSDDTGPTAPPSTRQVVPAVPIDGTASLRIAVPGDQEAVVQARALTVEGPKALPAHGVTRVAGGAVVDIDLTGLPDQLYALDVDADVPIVAAASVARRAAPDAVGDFAWCPSARPASDLLGVATPPHQQGVSGLPERTLSLTASRDDVVAEVAMVTASGSATDKRVAVSEDAVASLAIAADTASVWVRRLSGGELRGAVVSQIPASPSPLVTVTSLAEPRLEATAFSVVSLP